MFDRSRAGRFARGGVSPATGRARRGLSAQRRRATLLLLAATLVVATGHAAERLPALGVDLRQSSVSGSSSGGFMAVQFHVAHSSLVRGVGVIAGGPYFCAQESAASAMFNCMQPSTFTPLPATGVLTAFTATFAASGQIDSTTSLVGARVWLFSGTMDRTVSPSVVDGARRYYLEFVPAANVASVDTVPAGHAMVTADAGGACEVTAPPFINDCDFDAAGKLLEHIYGPLAPPAAKPEGQLVRFDQREFANGNAHAVSLADTGFAYVPKACETGGCRAHVAFHGCRQAAESIGEQFVRESGYTRWADSNRLVLLFPQTIARNGWAGGWRGNFVLNPRACWDWWGYTGPAYATRAGPQMRAVRGMLERLAQPLR
jgi:poly(3-hydroxybutyrate) depolymerase